jgi:H+/Cl- antiporter ClcA
MNNKIAVAVGVFLGCAVCALAGGYLILLAFKEGDCDGGCNSGELLWSVPAIFMLGLGLGWLLWGTQSGPGGVWLPSS